MKSGRDEYILGLIDRLDNELHFANEYALNQTAYLLKLAALDLKTVLHSITDEELHQVSRGLTRILERETAEASSE